MTSPNHPRDVDQKSRRGQIGTPAQHPIVPAPDATLTPVPEERRILAMAGEVRRVGKWLVPRLLRVRAFLGEVKIDLRENLIPKDFAVDVRAYGSRVTLVVPPGVDVIFDVFAFMGNAINQGHEPVGGDSRPTIRVVGSAYLGEVRVLVRERDR